MDLWVKQTRSSGGREFSNAICTVYYVFCFTFYILMLWFFGWLHLASAQQPSITAPATADIFLKQLATADYQSMGGSFVGSTAGANALNSNPAGLSFISTNRFVIHAARFSRTAAVVSRLNEVGRYEDDRQYDLPASGIELLNYAIPMGHLGVIGFDFARRHDGQFSRVDHLGKATNNFPQGDLAFGIGYSTELLGSLAIGIDARWLRSKVQLLENDDHVGHGYAYNLGLIQKIGEHLRVGAVVRNLSNGLSFSDSSVPNQIEQDVLFGGTYHHRYKNVDLRVGLDLNPPFKDGMRANVGGEIWYRGRIGGRIGYLRHTENRWNTIQIIQTETVEIEERIWKSEGPTFGVGVNLGRISIGGAYTPQAKPTENENEQIRVDQGEAVYSFSIGQGF